ncbi:(d)CMP kinase [Candidatus Gottesmanbacteria bacterium]|nr:(d)CMP kinase [Candidatus Gottesmanbacteria bacterium]
MTDARPLQIAIDGPVAAGKGDIAVRLAKELGLVYIYTGAMYRALGLACKKASVDTKNQTEVLSLLESTAIDLVDPDPQSSRAYKVLLNNADVTEELFTPEISMAASDVATVAAVRGSMVKRQQEMAEGKRVVMEGRDIGLRVLPNANLKIYLTAGLEERAKRRQEQLKREKGLERLFKDVLQDTKERDIQDTSRGADPLQKLPAAWELDTTNMTQDQVVAAIKKELKHRNLL